MNNSTLVVLIIIACMIIVALRYTKKHGLDTCNGDCSHCHGNCSINIKKGLEAARRELAEEKNKTI